MRNNFTFKKKVALINKVLSDKLLKEFDRISLDSRYETRLSNIHHLENNDLLNKPLLLSLLQEIKKSFQLITGFNDLNFKKLWLVKSLSDNSKKDVLPYIPHIDKDRYLKAMVYLHDVTIDHGPIHIGEAKNTSFIEQKRVNLPKNYKSKNLNTIDEYDLKTNLIPIIGKAGDVVFFDTNTPHKAGVIKKNYFRKVLRFDFERPFFNPKYSFLNRLINKIK